MIQTNKMGDPASPQPAQTAGTQSGAPGSTPTTQDTLKQAGTDALARYLTGGFGAVSGGGPIGAQGDFTPSNVVNTHPIGINLGAIMQPYNTGSPANGGSPLSLDSQWGASINQKANPTTTNIALIAVTGLVAILLIKRRKP